MAALLTTGRFIKKSPVAPIVALDTLIADDPVVGGTVGSVVGGTVGSVVGGTVGSVVGGTVGSVVGGTLGPVVGSTIGFVVGGTMGFVVGDTMDVVVPCNKVVVPCGKVVPCVDNWGLLPLAEIGGSGSSSATPRSTHSTAVKQMAVISKR